MKLSKLDKMRVTLDIWVQDELHLLDGMARLEKKFRRKVDSLSTDSMDYLGIEEDLHSLSEGIASLSAQLSEVRRTMLRMHSVLEKMEGGTR